MISVHVLTQLLNDLLFTVHLFTDCMLEEASVEDP
jgi:hypothetical protein